MPLTSFCSFAALIHLIMSNLYQKQFLSSGLNPESTGRRYGRFYFMLGILSLLGILSVKVALGQPFSGTYNFASVTTTSGTNDPTTPPTATGVTFGNFSAVGLSASSNATGRFSFTGNPTGATNGSDVFTGSFPTSQYFQVTVTVTGTSVNLMAITFTIQRSGSGIRQFSVRSSADGYAANLPASESVAALSVVPTNIFQITDATTSATTGSTITLSGPNFTNLPNGTTRTFRFYGWNSEATGGTFSIDDVVISGTSATSTPTITVSAASLPKFFANNGFASEGQSFTVTASNLGANNLTVGPLAGYEFSTTAGFASPAGSLSFTPSAGAVATTTVFARLNSTNAVGTYNGNIPVDAAGSGATAQNVAVTGQVYAAGSAFNSANILTLRVGESSGSALSSTSVPIFIDEYTTAGSFVQSVPMPFAVGALGTNNRRFTMSGSATSEGYLNLSPDGQFLTFAGYDALPGVSSIATTAASTTNRVVARIKSDASINTTTRINDGYDGNNIRSAATVDGNSFWTGGAGTGGGTRYMTLGNTGTSTQVSSTITNTRGTAIYNSQLYNTSQSGSNIGVNTVGSGLPTTTGNATTVLSGTVTNVDLKNPHGFVFVDQDDNGTPDVMYVADADAAAGGLIKFSNSGGTWTKRGSLPNPTGRAIYGITAKAVNATDRRIFLNLGTTTAIATEIYSFLDNSAIAANIASSGTDIITASGSPIITAAANTGFKGVSFAPIFVPTPTVNHTFTTPAASVAQGENPAPLYRIQCDITDGNALLTGVTVQTSGVYVGADINNFKLVLSTDGNLDVTDPVLSTISSSTGPGQTLAFTGLGQNLPAGTTRYLFIAASISGCATVGNSIGITSTPLSAITYSNPATVKNGTPAAGSGNTITLGTLDNVTGLSAISGTPTVPVSWTNPSCITEVIVVAHTSSITGTPSGTYTGNTNYALAPAFPGGGKVVYNGTASPQSISGLTIGQTYFFKVFVRFGANYSSGLQVTATPQLVNIYSRGSGISHTDAIWALTPNGTAQTLSAVGGLAADRGIIIQTGHSVQLSQSGGTVLCRELIVQAGATLTATGTTTGDNKFLNLLGNVTNNGTIGTGAIYNPICFGIEATNVTLGGFGVYNIGRIRKNTTSPNATSTLIIDANVNIRFTGGTGLYTNQDGTRLNTIINAGRTLNLVNSDCDLGLDGTNGLSSGERSGNVIVNGTLSVGDTIFARNNNTSPVNVCAITVAPTGRIIAGTLIADLNAGQTTSLNINSGGRVDIVTGLTVNSGTLNSNGGIRLLSSASGTARISNSVGDIAGAITAERYVPTSGWHLTGTTLAGQTIADWNDDLATYGPMPGVETPNPGYFTSSIFEYDETNNASIPYSDETTKGWIVPTSSSLVAGKGYRTWIPAGSILDNTGSYTMNPAAIPVSNSGTGLYPGFNLIMNPHLSAINASGITFNSAQNCVVIWNPQTNAYEYTGSSPVTGVNLNNSITPIASGQAFFVYTPSNTTITIPQTAKALSSGTFFRTNTQGTGVEIQLASADGARDAALFQFLPDASEAYEPAVDAIKFRNPGMNVYTINPDNQKLAINGLPFAGEQMILPLGYSVAVSGTYKLGIANLENLQADAQVFLRDNETGSIYALNENPQITFTTAATAGNDQRFELIFTQSVTGSPVPVVKADVQIFPNPATGIFTLAYAGLEGTSELEIRDMLGRLVSRSTIGATLSEVRLNCPEVAGRYMITIRNPKAGVMVKSLIVK